MRLRLSVQRHGLPSTDVLWTIKRPRGQTSSTISQLLEEINQRIPLEAQGWGLEDYVVRVEGYECLHYSEVDEVLRDGDQVSIEPLQTSDIRGRRLGGRYQITTDGRHLIDGISFGRRWHGQPARPSVKIPPRKRTRYTYDDDDDNHTDGLDELLTLLGGLEDVRLQAEEEEEERNDKDWVDDEDRGSSLSSSEEEIDQDSHEEAGSSELGEELEALAEEAGFYTSKDRHEKPQNPELKSNASRVKGILKSGHSRARPGKTMSKQTKSVGFVPFGSYSYTTFQGHPENLRRAQECKEAYSPIHAREIVELGSNEDSDALSSPSGNDSDSSAEFSPSESSSSHQSSSESEFSDADSPSYEYESAPQRKRQKRDLGVHVPEAEPSKSGNKLVQVSKNVWQLKAADYDEAPEEMTSKPQTTATIPTAEAKSSEANTSASPGRLIDEDNGDLANLTFKEAGVTPPYAGKVSTKHRNERRRDSKRLKKLKDKGLLPKDASRADLQEYSSSLQIQSIEEKRQKLLDAVASGGVDVNDADLLLGTSAQAPGHTNLVDHAKIQSHSARIMTRGTLSQDRTHSPPLSTARQTPEDLNAAEHTDSGKENIEPDDSHTAEKPSVVEPAQRRSKLDLASSRRMLFGSLGVRNPKNREEEEQLRNRLAQVAKPRRRAIMPDDASTANGPTKTTEDVDMVDAGQDRNLWKSRINLFAVECVDEDVKLSTPPFRFVQRWDPQQQLGRKGTRRGGKGKKRKRNNSAYYQDDTYGQVDLAEWDGFEDGQVHEENVGLNYDDEEDVVDSQPSAKARKTDQDAKLIESPGEQLINEMNDAAQIHPSHSSRDKGTDDDDGEDDLPPLPENPSDLHPLTFEAISEGTVIAFRKLDMSAETNYQPVLSSYSTAIVTTVDPLTKYISLRLAKRDHEKRVHRYDSEGNRIYGKFEIANASDNDSEDGEEHEGEDENGIEEVVGLDVSFQELIEPRLVKAAEESREKVDMAQSAPVNGSSDEPEVSGVAAVAVGGEPSKDLDGHGLQPCQSTGPSDIRSPLPPIGYVPAGREVPPAYRYPGSVSVGTG